MNLLRIGFLLGTSEVGNRFVKALYSLKLAEEFYLTAQADRFG